jgi:hypothetical protein
MSQFSRYNALAITSGTGSNVDPKNRLDLNGSEYSQCPASLLLNFIPDGGNDPVIEAFGNGGRCQNEPPGAGCNSAAECLPGNACVTGFSSVVTNLTVLPCNLDLQNGIATLFSLQFAVLDEFETSFSGSVENLSCWASFSIGDVPAMRSSLLPGGALVTQYATASISASVGGPVVGVAEVFHSDSIGNTASAAENLHMVGTGANATIRIADR